MLVRRIMVGMERDHPQEVAVAKRHGADALTQAE
jgi:hypothetical protein